LAFLSLGILFFGGTRVDSAPPPFGQPAMYKQQATIKKT